MRKTIIKIICFVLLIATTLSFSSCLGRSDEEREKAIRYDENGIGYLFSSRYFGKRDVYLMAKLQFDASGDEARVIIPDKFNDIPVVAFYVEKPKGWMLVPIADNIVKPDTKKETREKTFNLYVSLGENIEDIGNILGYENMCFYKELNDDPNVQYKYNINFIWYCAENNPNYYASDGKIYKK